MTDKAVVVVCLYGVYDRSVRSPEELAGYDQYFDAVAQQSQSLSSIGSFRAVSSNAIWPRRLFLFIQPKRSFLFINAIIK